MRIITCEHGGNRVPPAWSARFTSASEALGSHRGFDPGALQLARQLARRLGAPLYSATVSRLLVDLNRSLTNRSLFSEWSRGLSPEDRERLLGEHYHPYRQRVEQAVGQAVVAAASSGQSVLHISVHSFTPLWNGTLRAVDVGLLYDPRRAAERAFSAAWKQAIEREQPGLRVRLNYPYRGIADGLTTHLRRRFDSAHYLGIELEVNQAIVAGPPAAWNQLRQTVTESLAGIEAALP